MLKILTCGWSVCDVDHCTCLRAGISRLYGGVHYQRYTLILILHTSDSAPVHGKCSSVILSMVTQASKSRSWLSAVLAIDCWGNVLEPGLMKLRQFFELKFPNSVDHCTLYSSRCGCASRDNIWGMSTGTAVGNNAWEKVLKLVTSDLQQPELPEKPKQAPAPVPKKISDSTTQESPAHQSSAAF